MSSNASEVNSNVGVWLSPEEKAKLNARLKALGWSFATMVRNFIEDAPASAPEQDGKATIVYNNCTFINSSPKEEAQS